MKLLKMRRICVVDLKDPQFSNPVTPVTKVTEVKDDRTEGLKSILYTEMKKSNRYLLSSLYIIYME